MAVTSTFKQTCPACDASLTIRDPKAIGKKIECPRCKMKFVVEKPEPEEKEEVAEKSRPIIPKDSKAKKSPTKAKPAAKNRISEPLLEDEEDDLKPEKKNGSGPKGTKKKPGKKPADSAPLLEEDGEEFGLEEESAKPDKKSGTKDGITKDRKKTKGKGEPLLEEEDKDEKGKTGKAKKKKAKKKLTLPTNNKMVMGMALGGVGLVVLIVAGVFVLPGFFTPSPKTPKTNFNPGNFQANVNQNNQDPNFPDGNDPNNPNPDGKKPEDKGNPPIIPKDPIKQEPIEEEPTYIGTAEPTVITNLLPGDAQHVANVHVDRLLAPTVTPSKFRDSMQFFQWRVLKKHLGFSLAYVDRLIRAENYEHKWAYNVIHSTVALNEEAIVKAMQLEEVKDRPAEFFRYYKSAKPNALLDQLGHLTVGHRSDAPHIESISEQRPVYVCLHDLQTIIVADYIPMQEYLKVQGRFPIRSRIVDPSAPVANVPVQKPVEKKEKPKDTNPQLNPFAKPDQQINPFVKPKAQEPPKKQEPKQSVKPEEIEVAPTETYMTIHPQLKEALDRVEAQNRKKPGEVWFSSATTLNEFARLDPTNPLLENRILWKMRQVWDVTALLKRTKAKVHFLGTAFLRKSYKDYALHNVLLCSDEEEAKEVKTELQDDSSPLIREFFLQAFHHKVEIYDPDAEIIDLKNPNPNDPSGTGSPFGFGGNQFPGEGSPSGDPNNPNDPNKLPVKKKPERPKSSYIEVKQDDKEIFFELNLTLVTDKDIGTFRYTAALITAGIKNRLELVSISDKHKLGQALVQLGKNGESRQGVRPGQFPKAAYLRFGTEKRVDNDPLNRVGWMAGLLPYLGHNTLHGQIDFNGSWRDPQNWLAARTVVPEFLAPGYPQKSRMISYPGVPVDVAATHFVGVAGVGRNAADYPNESAFLDKLGIFGYERTTKLSDIAKGRGLSNTMAMIQIPVHSPSGMAPWMAGGGSTVRGIPEKDSLKPFVGDYGSAGRGAYVLMADGSVRFLKEGTSDAVVRSMATYEGIDEEKFDFNKVAPLVKPDGSFVKIAPKPEPKTKVEPKTRPTFQVPKGWKKVAYKEHGVSVYLPQLAAEEKMEPQKDNAKFFEDWRTLDKGGKHEFALEVHYLNTKVDPKSNFADKYFEQKRQATAKGLDYKYGSEKKLILAGKYPGREYIFTKDKLQFVIRFYMTEDRLYTLFIGGENYTDNIPEGRRIMDSFALEN